MLLNFLNLKISNFLLQIMSTLAKTEKGYLYSPLEQKFINFNPKYGQGELSDNPISLIYIEEDYKLNETSIIVRLSLDNNKTFKFNTENKYLEVDEKDDNLKYKIKFIDAANKKGNFQLFTENGVGCLSANYVNPFYKIGCRNTPENIWNIIYEDEVVDFLDSIK